MLLSPSWVAIAIAIPKSSSYNLRPGQTELDYTNMLDIDQDNTFTTSLQVSLKIFILSFLHFEVWGAVATEKTKSDKTDIKLEKMGVTFL